MRPVRSRVTAAIVLALLMVGSLSSVANADGFSTNGFTLAPASAQPVLVTSGAPSAGDVIPPTAFPEDPWPGLSVVPTTSFPEDPWPGLAQTTSFPEDPWPGLSN